MNYTEAKEKFENLPSDVERWRWIIENQDKGITVYPDNDMTFACFDNDPDRIMLEFTHFIGWDEGVFDLLEAVGIKAEKV
jgi:hypothetical protein